jgi:hypothetical protein
MSYRRRVRKYIFLSKSPSWCREKDEAEVWDLI